MRATIAAAAILSATAAFAQQGGQRPPAELTIINARSSPMVSFEIATTGDQPRLVARHQQQLAPGRSVKVRLNRASGCEFVVLARFADDSENVDEGMNLCGQRQIRLTD